jgi:hypothetical protein
VSCGCIDRFASYMPTPHARSRGLDHACRLESNSWRNECGRRLSVSAAEVPPVASTGAVSRLRRREKMLPRMRGTLQLSHKKALATIAGRLDQSSIERATASYYVRMST